MGSRLASLTALVLALPRGRACAWASVAIGGLSVAAHCGFSLNSPRGDLAAVVLGQGWVTWGAASIALVWSIWLLLGREPRREGSPTLRGVAFLAIGVLTIGHMGVVLLPAWRIDEGPPPYVLLSKHMLVVNWTLLARQQDGIVCTTLEVLSDAGERSNYAFVCRPRGGAEYEGVVVAPNGVVVALEAERCIAAYDPGSQQAYDERSVNDLSPFVLLGPADEGREGDLAEILERVQDLRALRVPSSGTRSSASRRGPRSPFAGIPSEAAVLDGLESENAWVREASRRIAAAGGADAYPLAFK